MCPSCLRRLLHLGFAESSVACCHAALLATGGLLAQLLVLIAVIGVLLVEGSSGNIVVNSAVFALVGVNILYMLVNIAPFQGSDGARLLTIAKQALSERRGSGT